MQHLQTTSQVLQTKRVTEILTPVDATLTRNRGWGGHQPSNLPTFQLGNRPTVFSPPFQLSTVDRPVPTLSARSRAARDCQLSLSSHSSPQECLRTRLQSEGSALRIRQAMRILSDHRESKDSSLGLPFAHSLRSLQQEHFTTLLQSEGSALFLKNAGCMGVTASHS
jgi:hypothetical protein